MSSLSRLSTEAEEIAPKAEWYARLAKNDLPADLDDVIKALHVSTSNLKSLADIRISIQTKNSICEMREGFELLYQHLDADSRRKNGCDDNSSHEKKRYLTDFSRSVMIMRRWTLMMPRLMMPRCWRRKNLLQLLRWTLRHQSRRRL